MIISSKSQVALSIITTIALSSLKHMKQRRRDSILRTLAMGPAHKPQLDTIHHQPGYPTLHLKMLVGPVYPSSK